MLDLPDAAGEIGRRCATVTTVDLASFCFHCALGFRTAQRLARALDSLVRVSRRVGEVTDSSRRPRASSESAPSRQTTLIRTLRAVPEPGYQRARAPRPRRADAESLLGHRAKTSLAPITLARTQATLHAARVSPTAGRGPRRTLVQRRATVHANPSRKVTDSRFQQRTA